MGVLDNKAVVITGGGGVLGRAYAKAMAKEGARIVVNDVKPEAAERVVAEIKAAGGVAVANSDSVTSWEGASHIIQSCMDAFGRIDCLVNNAHQFERAPIWEMTERAIDVTMTVHLKGHFACSHHASKRMMKQRSGSIITVTSRALNGIPGSSPYAAVKAGILGATFSWALELADYGVRVNCISPSGLQDPTKAPARHMPWILEFSLKQQGQYFPVPAAETVAPLVVYLASDDSNWVTGQVIFLSGDTLALLAHPREHKFAFKPDGWSLGDLKLYFRETIGATLEMPGCGVPTYRWYDGVK